MPRGAYTVSDLADDFPLRITCAECKRYGEYPKRRLLERFGAQATMPDVLRFLAKCERFGSVRQPCAATFLNPVYLPR